MILVGVVALHLFSPDVRGRGRDHVAKPSARIRIPHEVNGNRACEMVSPPSTVPEADGN